MRPLDAVRDAFAELLGRKPDQALPPLDTYDQIAAVFDHRPALMADAAGYTLPAKGTPGRDALVTRRRNWMRNPQRYERDRKAGRPRPRTPKDLSLGRLRQAAIKRIEQQREDERKRNPRTLEGLLEEARRRGIMVTRFAGEIRVSQTESYRRVDNIFLEGDLLDLYGVLADAAAGKWGLCAEGMAEVWGYSYMGLMGVQWLSVDTLKLRIGR